jgi:hypothetical protein
MTPRRQKRQLGPAARSSSRPGARQHIRAPRGMPADTRPSWRAGLGHFFELDNQEAL